MSECMRVPCGHLIESDPPRCDIGRVFPAECRRCTTYLPGLNDSERRRGEIWEREVVSRQLPEIDQPAGHD